MNEQSDEALALRAAGGCGRSFSLLLERHYDTVYRLAWRWCGSRSSAEDIAQDIAVKLATAIRGYRAEAKFATWLYRITYTTTIDFLRVSQRMVATEPSKILTLIDEATVADENADLPTPEVFAAVRRLPAKQRDAVLLVYGEGLSHAEAAATIGCSEKTVSWHIHEAKKRLKTLLEAVD